LGITGHVLHHRATLTGMVYIIGEQKVELNPNGVQAYICSRKLFFLQLSMANFGA